MRTAVGMAGGAAAPGRSAGGLLSRGPIALWWAGIGLSALVMGLLAGRSPLIALALAVAMTFVGLILADVSMGLYLFTFVAFLEVLPGVGGGLSFAKLAGVVLLLSWLATIAVPGGTRRSFTSAHPGATAAILLFLAWTASSALWAEAPSAVFGACFRYAPNLFLLPIAYTAIRSRRNAVVFATVFVATALLSALYGLATPAAAETGAASERLGGAGVDPNILAMTLVGAATMAAGLAAMRGNSNVLRAFAGVAAALCTFAVLGTVSRGGILSLVVVLVLAAAVSGDGHRAGVIGLVVAVMLSGGLYLAVLAPPHVRERITRNDGGAGRSDLWTVGWRMVQANPVVGVGAGNFPISSVHYLLRPGTITRSDFIVDNPKVAHNVYLEIPAELGVIGLALFLSIIGFSLRCAARASQLFRARDDRDMDLLCRAVMLAAAGMLTANVFISQQFNKPLWLLLAVAPALLALARRESGAAA